MSRAQTLISINGQHAGRKGDRERGREQSSFLPTIPLALALASLFLSVNPTIILLQYETITYIIIIIIVLNCIVVCL